MADPPPFDPSKPSTTVTLGSSTPPAFDAAAPSQAATGAAPPAFKPPPADKPTYASKWEQLYSLTSPIEAIRQLQGGVESEMAGKFGSKFGKGETLPSALGATLAQLVRRADVGVGGMEKGGEALAGKGEYRPGETLPPETTGALINLAGVRGFGLTKPLEVGAEGRTVAQIARDLPQTARDAAGKVADVAKSLRSTPEQKAAAKVSKTLSGDAAPTGADITEQLTAARKQGQPFTLMDIESPDVKNLAGHIYRQGGAAAKQIWDFFKNRDAGALGRVEGFISTKLSDASIKDAAAELKRTRSANAKAPFEKAMAGGSMAPLTHQFEQEMVAANQAVRDAQVEMAQTGNVRGFEEATKAQDEVLRRLERARADGTANAPGATWSPRLQEFLNLQEVQRGIKAGYVRARREAVTRGEPFNPREYAVLGEDEFGEPVVGAVPNMRLLAAGKTGLDKHINDLMQASHGRVNDEIRTLIGFRNAYREELYRLNPAYKAADAVWAGDTAVLNALEIGKDIFNRQKYSIQDVHDLIAGMGQSEREFLEVGAADAVRTRLLEKIDASDKGAIINTGDARRRLRPVFGSDAEANDFLDALERERTMKRTPTEVRGGAPSGERIETDRLAREATTMGQHLVQGNIPGAVGAGLRHGAQALSRYFASANPELNAAIARILTDPQVALRYGEATGRKGMSGPTTVVPPSMQHRIAPPQP